MTSPHPLISRLADAAELTTSACGDGRLVWRIWGAGPTLVLLHGDFGTWRHWARNIEALSRRFRVIAPDMPGYGESDLPEEASEAGLARILAAGLADVLPGRERYGLVGFSFGGIVAGHLVAIDATRVACLVLIGPGGLGFPLTKAFPRLQRVEPEMPADEIAAVHRCNLAALMFHDAAAADDLAVHIQQANIAQARMRAGDIPLTATLLEALEGVRTPLHAVWGSHDLYAAHDLEERFVALRRVRPDVDIHIVENAGHWAAYEAADEINELLMEFMSREA